MQNLPDHLYCVDSIVKLEQLAIMQYGIPAYELMKRAGAAVYNVVSTRYPSNKTILVLCGAGNNAGDGYVVARLARQAGYAVRVISLADPATLKNEARKAYLEWLHQIDHEQVGVVNAIATSDEAGDFSWCEEADIIIDAILGTGLTRDVSAPWSVWIKRVNDSAKPVISIDIPSGLIANTGHIAGAAIQAAITVCFIGLKQGMFTAQANDVCGEIIFDNLMLADEIYDHVPADARLIKRPDYSLLPRRKASSHKGCFGHVLIVGGNQGMPGAVILAARAALRTGAGLVTVITITQHTAAICAAVPEAMVKTCDTESVDDLFEQSFISDVTHLAIGMGLGQDEWSLALLRSCIKLNKPMLIDADALNLIAKYDFSATEFSSIPTLVITPHPGEAARLLSRVETFTTADVQKDRFAAIRKLHRLFAADDSCVVVLKGSGTLIFDGKTMKVCSLGDAAMAAPGMGDVLSGITIGLMAQSSAISDASASDLVDLAVCLHASAADSLVNDKSRGLLASDVVNELAKVVR